MSYSAPVRCPEESVESMARQQDVRSGTRMKMYAEEVAIDAQLVERLVAAQFPQLADLPISLVQSTGTVNAVYRLGDHLCARLPRVSSWAQDLGKEVNWLPRLALALSLRVPEPVATGYAGSGRPSAQLTDGYHSDC
jgi:aminoglycoside phosphotransferase (APT) family kinase protein